jgi:hypothetical protein
VITPDGRKGDFDDWWGGEGPTQDPSELLYKENPVLCEAMINAFVKAK